MNFTLTTSSGKQFIIEMKDGKRMHFAIWLHGRYNGFYNPKSDLTSDRFLALDDNAQYEISAFCDKIIANRMFL